MQKLILSGCLIFTYSSALGQTPETQLSFEVASVKPAAAQSGNPNTARIRADAGQLTYTNSTLKSILLNAYGVKDYQISGPGWLDSERYDILAKIPPGASKEQVDAMLRNLLAERFNLTLHHETKSLAVYELLVGKNGPKLKESDLNAPVTASAVPSVGKDGYLQAPSGRPMLAGRMADGRYHWTGGMQSLSGTLLSMLEGALGRPVLDRTRLNGKYDFKFEYSVPGPADTPSDAGMSLVSAVQEQLGLKLESKKDPIDVLVLDHIDKVPAEN